MPNIATPAQVLNNLRRTFRAILNPAIPAVPAVLKDPVVNVSPDKDQLWQNIGFPKYMVDAFVNTANSTKSIIMSRVPGPSTTQLIEENYDLKGYFIKAKSCNWGPMAGFLCRNPAFNKNGAAGINGNTDAHKTYLTKYFPDYFLSQQERGDAEKIKQLAFTQIMISDTRKSQILWNNSFAKKTTPPPKGMLNLPVRWEESVNTVYGVALDKELITAGAEPSNPSVIMEFVLKKSNNKNSKGEYLWEVYQGNVYTKEDGNNPVIFNIPPEISPAQPLQVVDIPLNASQAARRNDWLNTFQCPIAPIAFHPLEGVKNPYPPYWLAGPQNYLNTVSGDYDLFAVWPKIPPMGEDRLRRISEIENELVDRNSENYYRFSPNTGRLFLPAPGKEFALELTETRHVYLEFIPDGGDLMALENKYMGNVNDAVIQIAQELNSMATKGLTGPVTNKAFHSDEGGRPNVDEVEYPIAAFIPSELAGQLKLQPSFIINSHVQFLEFIMLVKGYYYVLLNYGWLKHWFVITHNPKADLQSELQKNQVAGSQLGPDDQSRSQSKAVNKARKAEKYFTDRIKEISKLEIKNMPGTQISELAWIRTRLKDLINPESKRNTGNAGAQDYYPLVMQTFWRLATGDLPTSGGRDALIRIGAPPPPPPPPQN